MRWTSVLSWKWLLSYILVAVTVFSCTHFLTPTAQPQTDVESFLQLGFYDLMSRRKEIYDSHMQTANHTILMMITNPNDNRFVLKGKFSEINEQNGKCLFSYTPIYYTSAQKELMIDGLVDMLMHVHFWMQPVYVDNQPLVIGQSGAIFFPHPLRD